MTRPRRVTTRNCVDQHNLRATLEQSLHIQRPASEWHNLQPSEQLDNRKPSMGLDQTYDQICPTLDTTLCLVPSGPGQNRLEQFHTDGNRLSDRDGARMLVALESISTRDALWADMTPRERRLPHRAVERPNPMRPTKPGQRRQRYSASPAGSAVTGRAPGAPSIRSRPMSPTRSPISSRRCFSAASTLASEEGDRTERELSDRGHCRPSPPRKRSRSFRSAARCRCRV